MSSIQSLVNDLKHLRLYMLLSDFPHRKQLSKYAEYLRRLDINKKAWQHISYADFKNHDTEDIPWLDKNISDEEIKNKPGYADLSGVIQQEILKWKKNGFMIIPKFFSDDRIDELERSIEGCLNEKELRAYKTSRIQDLWSKNAQVDGLFRSPELLKLLSFIFGKEVIPFQTINFYKGTQQAAHSDSIHFTTEPFGYLLAVWIALEDIKEGSGELMYYRGSHLLPFVTNNDYSHGNTRWKINASHYSSYEKKIKDIIAEKRLLPEKFAAKKGDILIWHANLLHGGSKIINSDTTRKSLVMHYYANDVLCYHERVERPAVLVRLRKNLSC